MGGGWLLEQPSTSCVEWHPRVRLLWRLLPEVGLWPKDVVTISKEVVVKLKWFYSLSWYYMRKCPAVCRCSVQSGGLACMGPHSKAPYWVVKLQNHQVLGFGAHGAEVAHQEGRSQINKDLS